MIVVLIVVIILLSITTFYCITLKRNLKKVTEKIQEKRKIDTNTLITTTSDNRELKLLIKEVNDLLISFRKLEGEVERKNNSLQKTIVNISHDLKTPLTSALGYMELLQEYEIDKDEQIKYQQIIIDKLKRVSQLIETFFEFTKIVASNESLQLQLIDSNRILEEAIVCYYQDFHQQNRKVELLGNDKVMMMTNEQVLRRIFDNIIINALKHGQGDLLITIEDKQEYSIKFSNVSNQTIEIERIFDEFYTSDISRTRKDSGLGLAIVKEFSEMLGGSVEADVEENMFTIILTLKKI